MPVIPVNRVAIKKRMIGKIEGLAGGDAQKRPPPHKQGKNRSFIWELCRDKTYLLNVQGMTLVANELPLHLEFFYLRLCDRELQRQRCKYLQHHE
jgi:hypothetical protein